MRMRKKRNVEERIAACGDYILTLEHDVLDSNLAEQNPCYIDFEALFGNANPVHLEIGCGKGRFACECARHNPDVNFLAVEKSRNVIVMGGEEAKRRQIPNLRFVDSGAEYLRRYIPDGSIERIYLNFSCPFPKTSYANRRLTNKRFLEIYKHILKQDGEIHQKTDNMHFFEYSIEQYSLCGFILRNVSLDLHASGMKGNIVTEYEEKFASLGNPIYRLEAHIR